MSFENTIKTPRLKLSVITMDDAEDVFIAMNCENTARIISFMTWPMTMAQAQDWCQTSVKGAQNKTEMLYIARRASDNATIGCIGLHHINEENKASAEVGYWILPDYEGQGYATEMLKSMLTLAFDGLGLQSVWATAIPTNARSHRVLEKQGFKITGHVVKPVAAPDKIAERNVYELKKTAYVA